MIEEFPIYLSSKDKRGEVADNPITEDMIREAGLAARSGVSGPSVSAQDFSFGESMFDSAHGNADGASVSGVGASVSDIAVEQVARLDVENRKKDDPASDAALIAEVTERVRKELIRIGQLTVSRSELIAFSQAMQDPEFRAQYEQSLRDKGVPEDQIKDRMDNAQDIAKLGIKVLDGTATAEETAEYDKLEQDAVAIDDLKDGLKLVEDNRSLQAATAATTSLSNAEDDFLASMESDIAMSAPDRQGSTIASVYNENALGKIATNEPNEVDLKPSQPLKLEV